MNRKHKTIRQLGPISVPGILCALWLIPAGAQVPVDDNGNPLTPIGEIEAYRDADDDQALQKLSAKELEQLVGPVALYPDNLLAIVLPAASYPLEIVQAARYLEDYQKDNSLQADENWNEAVTALLNYPEVLQMMNDNLDWTWRLGDAVLSQQTDVVTAVESFRDQAYDAGNLKSDKYQNVSNDNDYIEIEPVDEEIIYVPYYEPERVVVRQVEPVYYYYPRAYPVYYYPYPVGHRMSYGFFWGVTTAFGIVWSSHNLNVHHHSYRSHPYFGHHYFGHRYRRPSLTLHNHWYVHNARHVATHRYHHGDVWRPRHRSGARPGYYRDSRRNHYYTDTRRVVTNDYPANPSRNLTTTDRASRRGDRYDDRPRDGHTATRRGNDNLSTRDTRRDNQRGDRNPDQVTTRVYSDRTTPSLRASTTRTQRDRVKEAGHVDTTQLAAPIRFRDRSATTASSDTRENRQRDNRRASVVDAQPRSDIRFRDRSTSTTAQRSNRRDSKEDIHTASRQGLTSRQSTRAYEPSQRPRSATQTTRTTASSYSAPRERTEPVTSSRPKSVTRATRDRSEPARTIAVKPSAATREAAPRQREVSREVRSEPTPQRRSDKSEQQRESRSRPTRSDSDDRKNRRR